MTYVVNESCIKCKLMDCVEVCPVDCFYEGENMLVIHPDECIDCGVCEPECPVEAIKPDTEPNLEKWLGINAGMREDLAQYHGRERAAGRLKRVGGEAGQASVLLAEIRALATDLLRFGRRSWSRSAFQSASLVDVLDPAGDLVLGRIAAGLAPRSARAGSCLDWRGLHRADRNRSNSFSCTALTSRSDRDLGSASAPPPSARRDGGASAATACTAGPDDDGVDLEVLALVDVAKALFQKPLAIARLAASPQIDCGSNARLKQPISMIDRILTVGGITLLSRVTGFLRDIMLAAVLGAGPVADAFFVALRLPNHFQRDLRRRRVQRRVHSGLCARPRRKRP